MTILLNTARHRFVLTHHLGDVSDSCDFTCHRIGEDDLIGNLLLRILRVLNMDGNLLVIVADAAAHRGDALGLEAREEHLLSDAVGLQALTVDIEADLLLLLTEQFDVGHRGNTTQSIGEVVTVLFELTVAALVTLDSDE